MGQNKSNPNETQPYHQTIIPLLDLSSKHLTQNDKNLKIFKKMKECRENLLLQTDDSNAIEVLLIFDEIATVRLEIHSMFLCMIA